MNEFFRLIGEIVRDFSWRRISSLFLLLLFILAGLAIFESYTAPGSDAVLKAKSEPPLARGSVRCSCTQHGQSAAAFA